MPSLRSQACTTTEKRQREFLMGNKRTDIFWCKATNRLVLMGCGFGLYFLAWRLYFFICFTLSFDEALIFLLKRKKKRCLSYSKSLEEYRVGWFGGCVGTCQTISPLSCYGLTSRQAQIAWSSLPLQCCKTTLYRCLLHPELSAKNLSRSYWCPPNLLPTQGSQNHNTCSQLPLT